MNDLTSSGTAKGLLYDFMGLWWCCQSSVLRIVGKGFLQSFVQPVEKREIARVGFCDSLFHEMVARDEDRVCSSHLCLPLRCAN